MSLRTGSILKGTEERMVEAVIVTEEECKEVPRCTWRATDPATHSHIAPQLNAGMNRKLAMLKPSFHECGTSQSARDGLLSVHPPSPPLARDTPGVHLDDDDEVYRTRDASVERCVIITNDACGVPRIMPPAGGLQ